MNNKQKASLGAVVGMFGLMAFALINYQINQPKQEPEQEQSPAIIQTEPTERPITASCKGVANCFSGRVMKIIDGDTLDVENVRIRLALTNTPERGHALWGDARDFLARSCPVESIAFVDEDDGQIEGSFGRMIGKVYCRGGVNINAELLNQGLAVIDTRFCDDSEFSNESWAQNYGC